MFKKITLLLTSHWLRPIWQLTFVMTAVLLMIGFGRWLDMQVAHADDIAPLACPIGLQETGGLCYKPCISSHTPVGNRCYANCPTGYTDDGLFCRKDAHIFVKASYTRGPGVPMICATNQEGQGGLCYPKCQVGYSGAGPVCWQNCKAGYADHGATCFKHIFDFYGKHSYGRGAGVGVSACAAGLERSGALCYPRCAAGFSGTVASCFQVCPASYKDDGATCRRDVVSYAKLSYDNGLGVVMNSVPVAINETARTAKNTPIKLKFKTDNLDNDILSNVIFVVKPQFGKVDAGIYTPKQDFQGVDLVVWKASDGKNESQTAVATIIVGDPSTNVAPVAIDRTIIITEDIAASIVVTCTDNNNDPLFYQLVDKPQHGQYTWLPPNTVIYTPTANFVGTDQFSFRSYDGRDYSQVATITLKVNGVNDAPEVYTQPISTTRNTSTALGLVVSDAEGETLSYHIVASPTHGSIGGDAPNFVYIPNPDYVGDDSLEIKVSDPHSAAKMAKVTLSVLPNNRAPLAQSGVVSTSEESAVAINLQGSDDDGDTLRYSVVSNPAYGTLEKSDDNAFVYTPKAGFIGSDQFSYKVNDGQADSPTAQVKINVTAAPMIASAVGLVVDDKNGNGQADEGERGAGGLRVTLTATNFAHDRAATYEAYTDRNGTWRIDDLPLGTYNLSVNSTSAIYIAKPANSQLKLNQRGVQQLQPITVAVTRHFLFLSMLAR